MAEGNLKFACYPNRKGTAGYITVRIGATDVSFRSSAEYKKFVSEMVGFYNKVVAVENK